MSKSAIDYGTYLALDRLLECQMPQSAAAGRPAHDEMLFIVVHQAYELWFKQILHELDRVERLFGAPVVDDKATTDIVAGLERIVAIVKLTTGQIDVLETMTPLDFLDFRDLLSSASGFQSVQFRLIEARLGLPEAARLLAPEIARGRLSAREQAMVADAQARKTVLAALDAWLARTPFVEAGDYAFDTAYRGAVRAMLEREAARVRAEGSLDEARRADEVGALESAIAEFTAIFAPDETPGGWRMSRAALRAALFIGLYRDRPALQLPFRLLSALMDIDETMTGWRYRHALMVERMIGVKTGTGGSSGHVYLRRAAETHRVFGDLFRLSTYLSPRAAIPPLPPEIERRMGFVYAASPT
jgi:tryptophan 2,3-dioxygenase